MKIIHESEAAEKKVPGRFLRWIVGGEDGLRSTYLSSCVMRVLPGETVKPAHLHPNGEELIYVISGTGKVNVNGVIKPVKSGTAVLFEEGHVHMVRNTGGDELKVLCMFAPPSNLDEYVFRPEFSFDGGVQDTAAAEK
jgi:uncharacterized cupin superfamily protein